LKNKKKMRARGKPQYANVPWFVYGFQNKIVKHIGVITEFTVTAAIYDKPFIKTAPVNVLDAALTVTGTYEWTGLGAFVTDSTSRFCHPSTPLACTF
jgi:hypothetical protein